MWAGLLYSRALLTVSLAIFLLSSLLAFPLRSHAAYVKANPFLWLMPMLFIVAVPGGLWSDDTVQWMRILKTKLPLLLVPLLSLPLSRFTERTETALFRWMGATLLVSMLGSTLHYLFNLQDINKTYLEARVLPVSMDSDHVRFGWMLAVAFSWCLHLSTVPGRTGNPKVRRGPAALAAGIFVFAHLLSSRTGLLGVYMALAIHAIWYRHRVRARTVALIFLLAPVAAWLLLPTFRNRMKFVAWDFQNYSRGTHTEGLLDATRLVSLKAGWSIFERHPVAGCGFGDLRRESVDWYKANEPALKSYEQLLPSNEILLYGAAAGIPASLAFCVASFGPFFFRRTGKNPAWIGFHAISAAGFQYDIGLETQYGVFIYAFLGCWMYAYLMKDGKTPVPQDLPS